MWVHPEIANPEFKEEAAAVAYHVCEPCSAVGFELWQVKAGTIFDDIIVTDSLAEADAFAATTFDAEKDVEKAAYDAIQAVRSDARREGVAGQGPLLTSPSAHPCPGEEGEGGGRAQGGGGEAQGGGGRQGRCRGRGCR